MTNDERLTNETRRIALIELKELVNDIRVESYDLTDDGVMTYIVMTTSGERFRILVDGNIRND